MSFPKSSPVEGGDTATAEQYNNLRDDAFGMRGEIKLFAGSSLPAN